MKERIKITEVGPRDGLQNESKQVSTQDKLQFIELLIEAGLTNIEATSFVRADKIPQLADANELANKLNFQNKSISYCALTPNLKGYEAAIKTGFKEVAIFGAASESFTKKNINRTVEESLSGFKELTDQAIKDGIKVRGYISTVISCPYEGKISPEKVNSVVKRMQDLGVYEISLGETIGAAVSNEVEKLLQVLLKDNQASFFAGHFHDTYGMAIGNVAKSIDMGLRSFDASADIFDALTDKDRPYKKAVPLERALDILKMEVKDHHVDGDLLNIFIESRVFERLNTNKQIT